MRGLEALVMVAAIYVKVGRGLIRQGVSQLKERVEARFRWDTFDL